MKFFLAVALVMVLSSTPLAAQDLTVFGAWIGDAPGASAKEPLKLEVTVAKDGDKWSLDGILYKNGQKLTTFKGKDFKANGVQMLEFAEEIDKAPAGWPKPTKVVVKVTPS